MENLQLKKETKIELEITGLNHAGEGVGRSGKMAVFVPLALPGEKVLAEVETVKKNFARARLLAVTSASPLRRRPECPEFPRCGGCDLQHLAYEEQLRLKTGMVKENLARIGGLTGVTVRDTIGMDCPRHYRNKVHFQVRRLDGKIKLGFFAEGTHNLAGAGKADKEAAAPGRGPDGCLLVNRELNRMAEVIENLLNEYRVPLYDWQRRRGLLRHVMLRRGPATGESMAVLVTGRQDWPAETSFANDLLSACSDLTAIIRNFNDGPAHTVLGSVDKTLAGRDFIYDRLGPLKFKISAESFYQVNHLQTLRIYRLVHSYAGLTGAETILDAYCGAGTIALFLAGAAGKIYGLELSPAAVKDALDNATINNIKNVEFKCGVVEELLPAMGAQGLSLQVAALDPPRRGCHAAALEALASMRVPRLIYVSCNPATLSRDLGYLAGRGYETIEVQPFDMFPMTAHVECVVLMSRVEK